MYVLGLNFGHDAAVAVLKDGQVINCVMRERVNRIKNAATLRMENIRAALDGAGITLDDIDYCALISTQSCELIIDSPEAFSISFDAHPKHTAPSPLADHLRRINAPPERLQISQVLENLYGGLAGTVPPSNFEVYYYGWQFPEHATRPRESFGAFGCFNEFGASSRWQPATLDELGQRDFSSVLADDAIRMAMHYPVTVRIDGRSIAGYMIQHHMGHAASSYFHSGFPESAIMTHDAYDPAEGTLTGLYYWAQGHRIYPLAPHYLIMGAFYDATAEPMGLGRNAAGKLMGLASYGNPRFFDRMFVGNYYQSGHKRQIKRMWREHCTYLATAMGYDITALGDPKRVTAPVNLDIAASTHKVFEESILASIETLHKVLTRAGRKTHHLCLSGGTALSCPLNSRIWRESRFPVVSVEPACNDSGLAIGAALWLYHTILDRPVSPRADSGVRQSRTYPSPYLGLEITQEQIESAIRELGDQITVEKCGSAPRRAAEDLAADRVIGWFEGRSEIGPRALGHRSILADPRQAENWPRVNRIKGRESWRPFAPAVLEEDSHLYFAGLPVPSPYMLFTGRVLTKDLPAITHVDGTARVQTVNASAGQFHDVLLEFKNLTGCSVVLNTSFNGPGEAIVETPQDALRFLLVSPLDAVYMGGYRISRVGAAR